MGIGDIHGDPLIVQLLGKGFELGRGRDEDNVRREPDDPLDAWFHRIANLWDTLGFGWIVAVFGITHQAISSTHRIHDLSKIWGERDDAINMPGQPHAPAGFVGNFASFGV